MNDIQRISVEIDGEPPFDYIIAKQGEANSRIVEVELFEKNVPYVIPEGIKAMIKYRKPDGKKVLNDCTYAENIVTVMYTEQMLAAYGTGKGEIMLVEGTEIIKSATFYTKVVETVYKENGLISDDEFQSLAGTLIEVNETLEKIDSAVTGAEQAVEDAEQALQEAEEMKQSCETATENANQAAEACTTATADMQEKCNEAIENANTAAIKAETATGNANQAAEACTTATADMQEECSEALDMIGVAISEAEEATGNAIQAIQDCNTAIQNATAATEEANRAAEQCNDIIDGLTPRIGEDGNWYVGNEDTGVKANGGITVYDGFDSDSTENAASARTVKELKEEVETHTHTKDDITDFPTSLKNPSALTLSLNGTSQGAYDGSASKSINITAAAVGAAASSHTHNYAASSSAGGAATSAVKLQTGRTITIGSQANTFDGSAAITFTAASMGLAPASHASTGTGYGVGTASNYGHVKLSDSYASSAGAASASVAASSLAVYNAYNALYTGKIGKTTLKTISATGTTTITITPPCLIILKWSTVTWAELIVVSGYKSVLGTSTSSSAISTGISGTTYSITLNTTAYGGVTYGVINF